eukprot:CAMPEP_0203900928 /NCGR_PEP_ID=MMETSP0359-20131031/43145_1 /ASSEMBLY_ACC=CAM_ASM_000338 /TAXON_ID=268821 /ORGANISM="Scrippsiella Hangoei, Strain SHTV-5" /LENGTH=471 /DNA_ID=CAMNT_0050824501 /DNA_START=20 /DNA_END=1435 /DNA_ORIENTATION=+
MGNATCSFGHARHFFGRVALPRSAWSGHSALLLTGLSLYPSLRVSAPSAAELATSSSEGATASDAPDAPACEACFRKSARVFCGGEHTLLRDPHTLEVYQLGACGLGFDHDYPASGPSAYCRKVPLSGPAQSVFAGYYHNLFKLTGGRCFAYGCGRQAPNDGQLMNGTDAEDTFPTATTTRFAEASVGGHHSVCRTMSGEVWNCGAGWQGQMGDGGLQYKNTAPKRLSGVPRIEKVAGGYYHNAALGEDGEWYAWGCNEQGQLGPRLDGREAQIKSPVRLGDAVPELKGVPISAFDGGYGHSVILLGDGRILTMGNHSEGQRGLDPELDEAPSISEVSGLPGPAEAIAGGNHHTLIVVGGRVFAVGSDEFGQVGGRGEPPEEHDQRRWQPQLVEGLPPDDPVVRVSAGICHSAAQTASGRVFLWGCGSNGQLGDSSLPAGGATREVVLNAIAQQCRAAIGAIADPTPVARI